LLFLALSSSVLYLAAACYGEVTIMSNGDALGTSGTVAAVTGTAPREAPPFARWLRVMPAALAVLAVVMIAAPLVFLRS
jgi:hypothetical protein